MVNVYVKKEGDILYDVQVYGDTEVGRVFRIGWDDVIMDEDYIYLLELTHVKSTADSGKAPKRKRDGWITELTGEDAVYYSMKVAMRKYDDELVKKDGRQVRARALNIPDDFVFERGAAPMRSKVYTAGKEGRNPNTVSQGDERSEDLGSTPLPPPTSNTAIATLCSRLACCQSLGQR